MSRYCIQGVFKSGNGKPIVSGTGLVYLAGSTTLATIYAAATMTLDDTAISGSSVTSDSNGKVIFYYDDFDYDSDQTFKLVLTTPSTLPTYSITYDNIKGTPVLGTYTISTAKTVTTRIAVPFGVDYHIEEPITIDAHGSIDGPQNVAPVGTRPPPTVIKKLASATGYAVILAGEGASMTGIGIDATAGSAGGGIHMKANSTTLRNVSVMNQAENGIDVGVPAATTNCNLVVIDRVTSNTNAGHGLYISSNDTGAPDANVTLVMGSSFIGNTLDGVALNNTYFPTLVGNTYEANGSDGVSATAKTAWLTVIGGDSEGNTSSDWNISLAKRKGVFLPGKTIEMDFEASEGFDVVAFKARHVDGGGASTMSINLGGHDDTHPATRLISTYDHSTGNWTGFQIAVREGAGNTEVVPFSIAATGVSTLIGDMTISTAAKGVVLKNAAGTVTKRVRLNDAGNGLLYEDP